MTLPTISIITPSYNQGEFLEETILSVLGQRYPALQYIIIDGGSTDNSLEIIKKYEKELYYWESKKDKGQSHAINKGFKQSTGDILMWLNSDDMLMPNALNYIANLFLKNKEDFYFGNCIRFNEKTTGMESFKSDVVTASRIFSLEQSDYIIQSSSFWTRKVYQEVGELNEDLHYGLDWEWFLRVKRRGIKMAAFNKCISLYRVHDSHKTGKGGRKRQEELLSIYEIYNPKGAKVYEYLMEQDKDWNIKDIYKAILLKKYYYILKKPLSEARILQLIKPKKYGEFTELEIGSFQRML
jgi:glycosyltransferase involved in cell wall biosynthesis